MTLEEQRDLARRRSEDFQFMVICAAKGNMDMYELLRDKKLDEFKEPKQLELSFSGKGES